MLLNPSHKFTHIFKISGSKSKSDQKLQIFESWQGENVDEISEGKGTDNILHHQFFSGRRGQGAGIMFSCTPSAVSTPLEFIHRNQHSIRELSFAFTHANTASHKSQVYEQFVAWRSVLKKKIGGNVTLGKRSRRSIKPGERLSSFQNSRTPYIVSTFTPCVRGRSQNASQQGAR